MIRKLTDRIYYMPHDFRTDRPLLGLVCGDKYSLVVDSGNSPKHAKKFLEQVSKLNIAPLKYLVLTHWHWDHVFGIAEMKLTTICHTKTNEKLKEMQRLAWDDASLNERVERGEEIEFCREHIKLELTEEERKNIKIGSADITFNDSLEIDLGGISCIIENAKGDHSEDSSIIYVPAEETIFLGDSHYEDVYTGAWSYTREKLFPYINQIRGHKAQRCLTSHNTPETAEKLNGFFDQLIEIGNFIGSEMQIDKAVGRYKEVYGKEPDEEEVYYMNAFINGNKKLER